MERTFTETEVRRLLWLIGYITPLNKLGDIYDRMGQWIVDGEYREDAPLLKIARGTWQDAGSYGVGVEGDPNCDQPNRAIW